jgi:hypothetical protein
MNLLRRLPATAITLLTLATPPSSEAQRRTSDSQRAVNDSLLALDSAWARTYALHDTVVAGQLMAEDFFMTTTSGEVKSKAAELGDVRRQPGLRMDYFRTAQVRSRVYGNAAVVTGEAAWQFEMNGRVITNRRRYTAVYARGGPLGWQLVALHMGRAPENPASPPTPVRPSGRTPFDGPQRTTLTTASVNVPLTKTDEFYYADVMLNGRPFRFALETGAGFFAVSWRAAAALGLLPDTIEIGPPPVIRVDSLTVGGATFHNIVARVSSTFDGRDFDGIISIPVLRDVVATLDLARSRLVLDRGELPPPNEQDVFPVAGHDRGGRIDVMMRLDGLEAPAVIDTRSPLWLIAGDSLIGTLRLESPPRSIGTAWGPSLGTFELRGTRLAREVRLGQHIVQRPPVLFRERPGVVIGVPFLEQFVVSIDQRNQRVRFARPQGAGVMNVPAQPWETGGQVAGAGARAQPVSGQRTMGFGIAGRPSGGRLTVVNVVPGSSAEKVGLKAGDQIVEVDGTLAASMSPMVVRTAVSRGGPVKVVVLRDGQRLEFTVEPYVVP